MQTIIKPICILTSIVFLVTNCGNESKNIESENALLNDSSTASINQSTENEDNDETSYTLPSPLQIASIFKKSGLKYQTGITNSTENVIKYTGSNYIRAVNMGVYSSDLAFTILNKQYQEGKKYLKACKDMGAQLGINRAFELNNLATRFDKNIDKEDSLIEIISTMQMESDILLEQNNQKHLTAIAFAGAWIESIYIAAKVYNNEKNKKLIISIMEQFSIAENIMKALRKNQDKEPGVKELINDVENIVTIFNNCEAVKKAAETDEDVDFSKIPLTENELDLITKKINEVREKLVK